jgi:sulfur carrier protein
MAIEVNFRPADWVEGETVKALLERMNYKFPLVVVKIDGRVVKKDQYGSTGIPDGSKVEVIHLISGG